MPAVAYSTLTTELTDMGWFSAFLFSVSMVVVVKVSSSAASTLTSVRS